MKLQHIIFAYILAIFNPMLSYGNDSPAGSGITSSQPIPRTILDSTEAQPIGLNLPDLSLSADTSKRDYRGNLIPTEVDKKGAGFVRGIIVVFSEEFDRQLEVSPWESKSVVPIKVIKDHALSDLLIRSRVKNIQRWSSVTQMQETLDERAATGETTTNYITLLKFDDEVDVDEARNLCKQLVESGYASIAEPDYVGTAHQYYGSDRSVFEPSDPDYADAWQHTDLRWGLRTPFAWQIVAGNRGIKMGILDDGFNYLHQDFGGGFGAGYVINEGWDYIDNDSDPKNTTSAESHGTKVAGVVSAKGNNGVAGVGVAGGFGAPFSGTKLVGLRVAKYDPVKDTSFVDFSVAAKATLDAAQGYGVNIVNFSYGGPEPTDYLRWAWAKAFGKGVLLVTSMGNTTGTCNPCYPALLPEYEVLSVGNSTQQGNRSSGSLYGNGMDVLAPGSNILTISAADETSSTTASGTSFSAPHAGAVASLIIEYDKFTTKYGLTHEDIQAVIKHSASPANGQIREYEDQFGYGIVDSYRALRLLGEPYKLIHGMTPNQPSYELFSKGNVYIYDVNSFSAYWYYAEIYKAKKTIDFTGQYVTTPYVWGRSSQTNAWNGENPNFQVGYAGVTGITKDSATFEGFAYKIWDILGRFVGWYPAVVHDVAFSYTILGIKADPAIIYVPQQVASIEEAVTKVTSGQTIYVTDGSYKLSTRVSVPTGAKLVLNDVELDYNGYFILPTAVVTRLGFVTEKGNIADLNHDGCVDKTDVTQILGEIRHKVGDHDLNGDGAVNVADARMLVTLFTNPTGNPCL